MKNLLYLIFSMISVGCNKNIQMSEKPEPGNRLIIKNRNNSDVIKNMNLSDYLQSTGQETRNATDLIR
jgi:hypothetical protein